MWHESKVISATNPLYRMSKSRYSENEELSIHSFPAYMCLCRHPGWRNCREDLLSRLYACVNAGVYHGKLNADGF